MKLLHRGDLYETIVDEELKIFLFRFYTVGLKSAILFGMINYDIMIIYDKFVDRFWNVVKMLDL